MISKRIRTNPPLLAILALSTSVALAGKPPVKQTSESPNAPARHLMPPDPADDLSDCPDWTTEIDVAACRARHSKDYGSEEHPMQIGIGVGGFGPGMPWEGRLLCPGGGWPVLEQMTPSTRVKSMVHHPDGGGTVFEAKVMNLNRYHLLCPGQRRFLIHNDWLRCQDPCVPAPFGILPVASERAFREGLEHLRAGRLEDAAALAKVAVKSGPPSERNLAFLAEALFRARRFDEAIQALEQARRIDPDDPKLLFQLSETYQAAGQPEKQIQSIDSAIAKTSDGHPMKAHLVCRQSFLVGSRGDFQRARHLEREACRLGAKRCCEGDGRLGPSDAKESTAFDSFR